MNIRTRIIVCIYILSALISLIILALVASNEANPPKYTEFSDAVLYRDSLYLTDNDKGNGFLFRIDADGRIKNIFRGSSTGGNLIDGVSVREDRVYALFSKKSDDSDEVSDIYILTLFDPALNYIGDTDIFRLEENETVTNLSAEPEGVFITTVALDGTRVGVYRIPYEDIIDAGDEEAKTVSDDKDLAASSIPKAEEILSRESSGLSYYVDAKYIKGNLTLRTDQDKPDQLFLPDPQIKAITDNISFGLVQWLRMYNSYIVFWLMSLILWYILLTAMIYNFRDKNRVFYQFLVLEGVIISMVIIGFTGIGRGYLRAGTQEYVRYGCLALHNEMAVLGNLSSVDFEAEDYYGGADYRRIQSSLSNFFKMPGNDAVFSDVFLLNLKDGYTITSLSGKNREPASWMYGSVIDDLRDDLLNGSDNEGAFETEVQGEPHIAVSVTDGSGYGLVGIMVNTDPGLALWQDLRRSAIACGILIILGTALLVGLMYLRNGDLRRFERAMNAVALGQSIEGGIPEVSARDMASMWASLAELQKKLAETNYSKFRIFEAYYRFAPKNIETILGKGSIFEVKNGESIDVSGSLMVVNTDTQGADGQRMDTLTRTVSYMEQYADNKEGMLVSQDSELSVMEFLFKDEERSAAKKATQFLQQHMSLKDSVFVSVFIYYAVFKYGIVGISARSLTFLSYEHSKIFDRYAKWFKELKIRLVVTEDIKRREEIGEARYIGYFLVDGNEDMKICLYEVLDVCPMRERQVKIVNKERFESAIETFYAKDFYTARNRFSDILKECPEDEMARWYLFESQKYLSEVKAEESFRELKPKTVKD